MLIGRDDALCHVRLLESVHVGNGERYIAWSTETATVEEIEQLVGSVVPEAGIAAATSPRPGLHHFPNREQQLHTVAHGL